jgi:hypothetical protein
MCDELRPLLNAYLDGELHGPRLLQLQNHLASCESCRDELNELRRVSDLLHAAPAPEFMPADRFISQLKLQLPRRSLGSPKPVSWVWWLVPAGLLFAWFFVQTVFTLSRAISLANATNLLGNAAAWLSGGTQHTLWFDATRVFFGSQPGSASQSAFSFLDQLNVFGADILGQFFWQAVIVLLYWAWLAVWWVSRRPGSIKMPAGLPRS